MTTITRYTLLLTSVVLVLHIPSTHPSTRESLEESYKKIGDELVSIRRKYPDVQPKIYAILDKVDSIYKVARVETEKSQLLNKQVKAKESEVKEVLKTKDLENSSLQNEVIALKSVLDSTQHKLEVATKHLELEKKYSNKLSLEIAKISHHQQENSKKAETGERMSFDMASHKKRKNRKKIKSLTENSIIQSLNLTSSSAPNSPR